MSNKPSTKLVGDISELMVQTELLKNGFSVLIPLGDRLPYDLVEEQAGIYYRIQVKTLFKSPSHKSWTGNLALARTNRKKSIYTPCDKENVEFFVFVCQQQNQFFVIPTNIAKKYKKAINVLGPSVEHKLNIYQNNWNLSQRPEAGPTAHIRLGV